MRSENATLQDSNIIELNLSHDCNKQECQDVFSMKQNNFQPFPALYVCFRENIYLFIN